MNKLLSRRPPFEEGLMNGIKPDTEMGDSDMMRYCFEVNDDDDDDNDGNDCRHVLR